MLGKIVIKFESENKIIYNYSASSVMHGALMEVVDCDYADYLHSEGLRPFSQNIQPTENGGIWSISVLNQEAYNNIIVPVLQKKELFIKHKNDRIILNISSLVCISYEDFIYKYSVPVDKVKFRFATPTTFKSNKKYCHFPSEALIFQSLARRFEQNCSIKNEIKSFSTEDIESFISVGSYNLHSTFFGLEGIRIPAFMGEISFNIKGSEELRSYINMLSEYAEYSGAGIKTALGMGNIKRLGVLI